MVTEQPNRRRYFRLHPTKRFDSSWITLLLAAITVVALGIAWWSERGLDPLRGDSAEYLFFDPSRSVGYPAFLALIKSLTGDVGLAVVVQTAILAAALLALGLAMRDLIQRPLPILVLYLLLVGQAGLWFTAGFLMTEALSAATVAFWCALLIKMGPSPSRRGRIALVGLAAVGMMIRPPLVALVAGSALFILTACHRRDRIRALTVCSGMLVLAWSATPVAQWLVHGSPATTSPLARGILQHSMYCEMARTPHGNDAEFVERVTAPVRAYIASSPVDLREQLRREYSTPLRFGLIIPMLGRAHGVDRRSEVDPYLMPIAIDRVRSNPRCYLDSVAGEYGRMAVFATDPSAEQGRRVNEFVAGHPPPLVPQVPLLGGDGRMARDAARELGTAPSGLNPLRQTLHVVAKVPLIALLPFRLVFGCASLIGLLAMAALATKQGRGDSRVLKAAAMGLAVHGTLIITAIVEIGFFRYLMPLWPMACAILALGYSTAAARGAGSQASLSA